MIGSTRNMYPAYGCTNVRIGLPTLRGVFLYVILLGLEFDIRFYGPFTLRKIAFLAVLAYIFHQGISLRLPLKKIYAVWGLATCVLFLHALFIQTIRTESIAIPGNSDYPAIQIIFQALFLFLLPVMLSQIFRSTEEFFRVQLGIITLQAAIAIVSRFNKPFRVFVYQYLTERSERMADHIETGMRVCIMSNAGATASWILFIGCIICAYYILSTGKVRYLILCGIIMVSMIFVGRTGLYMALLLIVAILFYSLRRYAELSVKMTCVSLLILLIVLGFFYAPGNTIMKERTLIWVGEIFLKGTGEGSTVDAIRNMPVPPLNWETFLGTGIAFGVTKSGLVAQSDMGYAQTYAAWGLIGVVFYYLWSFGFFAHEIHGIREKRVRAILWIFLIFMIIVEWKEPFLRKTPNAMVLMTAVMLQQKNERLSERNHHDRKGANCFRPMPKLQP